MATTVETSGSVRGGCVIRTVSESDSGSSNRHCGIELIWEQTGRVAGRTRTVTLALTTAPGSNMRRVVTAGDNAYIDGLAIKLSVAPGIGSRAAFCRVNGARA
jgi:hypothetical protein